MATMCGMMAPISLHGVVAARRPLPFSPVHIARTAVRPTRVMAADLPVATDVVSSALPETRSNVIAVRKYLLSAGMNLAWVDGVTAEISKRTLTTSPERCKEVVVYLSGLGASIYEIENMTALCKPILGQSVDNLKAVVAWLDKKGVSGDALVPFLLANPTLLTYTPSANGEYLEKGSARANVLFGERGGRAVAGASHWREAAVFGTAPVTPAKPV